VRFFCDEGVDRQIVDRLRADGFAVDYVAEISPSIQDEMVLEQANARGALLVTVDKDFGELYSGSAESPPVYS
jgi:predicted nuclease of predicted toxin-antitoxin system